MKERLILFSAPMIRAILDGRKTQTRRVVKHQFGHLNNEPWYPTGRVVSDLQTQPGSFMEFRHRQQDEPGYSGSKASTLVACPYGTPGDRLWVRETFHTVDGERAFYRADYNHNPKGDKEHGIVWTPSIHMPRWASRITLKVTDVRVERLQDISEKDAWAEGCEGFDDDVSGGKSGYCEYAELWESINGKGSWEANPWVWVVEFRWAK